MWSIGWGFKKKIAFPYRYPIVSTPLLKRLKFYSNMLKCDFPSLSSLSPNETSQWEVFHLYLILRQLSLVQTFLTLFSFSLFLIWALLIWILVILFLSSYLLRFLYSSYLLFFFSSSRVSQSDLPVYVPVYVFQLCSLFHCLSHLCSLFQHSVFTFDI